MIGIRLGRMASQIVSGVGGLMKVIGKGEDYLKGGEGYDPLSSPFEESRVTQDPDRFLRSQSILKTCPEIAQGSATYGWMREALRSTDQLFKKNYEHQIPIPVLLCLARSDQLVNIESSERFAAALPNCRRVDLENAEHEILMERDEIRLEFWSAFDEFLIGIEP